MAKKTFTVIQDPNAVWDREIDWSELGDDPISVSTWEIPDELTQPFPDTTNDFSTIVWISGGVDGEEYTVVNHILTEGGREEDAVLIFRMQELF